MYVGDRITEKNKNYLKKGDILVEECWGGVEWRVFDREGKHEWFFAWQFYGAKTAYDVSQEFIKVKKNYPHYQEFSYHDAGILHQTYNNHKSYYMGNAYDLQDKNKFKIGGKVRCVDSSDSDNRLTFGKDYTLLNYYPHYSSTECEIIDDKGYQSRWRKGRFIKIICVTGESKFKIDSEYYEIRNEIADLKGWDKKADDILSKLLHNSDGSYGLVVFNFYDGSGSVAIYDTTREKSWDYNYTDRLVDFEFLSGDQCKKLEAFKRALLWLLAHSKIEREKRIKKLKQKQEELYENYRTSLDSINAEIKDLKSHIVPVTKRKKSR